MSTQPQPDRLVEIEEYWLGHAPKLPRIDDIRWLITGVKELRSREEGLLQQLSRAATENTQLRSLLKRVVESQELAEAQSIAAVGIGAVGG